MSAGLMSDASEIVQYDAAGIPLYIRRARLGSYPGLRAAAHWHEDLEFIGIAQGEMCYSINGNSILLQEGDALFVNSRQLHYGYDSEKQDCLFLCILVHPSLLAGSCPSLQNALAPMLEDASFPYCHFSHDPKNACRVFDQLSRIWEEKEKSCPGFRFRCSGILTELTGDLLDLWHEKQHTGCLSAASPDPDLETVRRMVAFVERNYAADLSLNEIAEAGSVSRSTCCRLFRKYVSISPLGFLNSYRLQTACELLHSGGERITAIAVQCGFNHPSYFSQQFKRYYGCTPREFRGIQRAAFPGI